MVDILGVHGIGQQQGGRNQLLPAWQAALDDGMERAKGYDAPKPSLDIAYYGDIFLPRQTTRVQLTHSRTSRATSWTTWCHFLMASRANSSTQLNRPGESGDFCSEYSAGGWSPDLSVVGRLQFDGWDVPAVLIEAVVVEPVDPFGGGEFDLLDGPPGLAWFDQLGLVQAVDRFGQGVVIGAADRADRGLDPGVGEPLGEPDRSVLRTSICMVDNIFQVKRFLLAGGSRSLVRSRRGPSRSAIVDATRQPRIRRA